MLENEDLTQIETPVREKNDRLGQMNAGSTICRTETGGCHLDTIVLLSGGIDSTALIHFLQSRGHVSLRALHIDYGQPAKAHERAAAHKIAEYFSVKLQVVTVSGLPSPEAGYVFGRNALLLALAATVISSEEGVLAIGVHGGTDYPDCHPRFVGSVQHVLDTYSGGCLRVLAPFANWSKRQMLEYAASARLPLHLTRSCEASTVNPCGACLSCRDLETIDVRSITSSDISE